MVAGEGGRSSCIMHLANGDRNGPMVNCYGPMVNCYGNDNKCCHVGLMIIQCCHVMIMKIATKRLVYVYRCHGLSLQANRDCN